MDIIFKMIWRGIVALFRAINSILLAGDRAVLSAIGRPPELSPEAHSKLLGYWDRTRDPIARLTILVLRLISIVVTVTVLYFAVKGIYQAFHIGPAGELTNVKHQSEIPTTQATPGEPFRKVHVQENWLTISQAEDLKIHPGSNLVEVNQDGTVRYSASQSVNFNGQSPWIRAGRPGEIDGLNLKGTSVVLTIYGQTIEIYIDQPFFLAGDKDNDVLIIYVVDQYGQLWMANANDPRVLVSLKDAHPQIKLNPDPLLTPGS